MKTLFFCTLLITHISQALNLESGSKQVHLLELYSSEGCSSCPPAERWLVQLKDHPKLWKQFVPIEFHVDYWNRLGWVDPFSNKSFTRRQHNYASEWNSNRVYTPGFVLDGNELKTPSLKPLVRPSSTPGKLIVNSSDKTTFQVSYEPTSLPSGGLRVFVALLGSGLVTKVPRGENAGETLHHEFVVLKMKNTPLKKKGKKLEATLTIGKKTKAKPKKLAIAVWVSSAQTLSPLQATGGFLD